MKHVKLSLVALTCLASIIGVFAFSIPAPPSKPQSNVWYNYNGTGPIGSASSYTQISGQPSCFGDQALCAIQLPDVAGSQPSQSDLTPLTPHIQEVMEDHDTQDSQVKLRN